MTQTAPKPAAAVAPSDARETVARLRHLPTSPPKVRMVLQLIRGQDIERARDTLRLCERGIARDMGKLLESAVANAGHNDNMPEDELFVSRAFVDEGPTLKRWRPRARGRGVRIRKRTSHVTIAVARFEEDELQRRRGQEATGPARRRPTRRRAAPVEADEHDHDHDHDHDEDAAGEKAQPAKKATKKATTTTKKTTKKAQPAKKAAKATKKATKKSTTKRAPRKKKDE